MGNIHDAIAGLVGLEGKQRDDQTSFVRVVDLGGKGRVYAMDADEHFYRLESLKGIKNNPNWQKQPDGVDLPASPKHRNQTTYLRVQQDESANDEAIVYPSLVYTRTGYLVQLAV